MKSPLHKGLFAFIFPVFVINFCRDRGELIMVESTFFTVGSLARRFGVLPKRISDLFWQGKLSGEICPVVDGRRIIPASYVPEIERILSERRSIARPKECATNV